jgi:hypothetical protein
MTVPGIGPIISSAMVAAIGTGDAFSKGRDFGAWLGLVPKQLSTGDRTILGSISKRGNRYLRSLFVQAAWVVLVKIGPKHWDRYGLKSWIEAARKRLHHNVLAIALANKLAPWAVRRNRQMVNCYRSLGRNRRPGNPDKSSSRSASPGAAVREDWMVETIWTKLHAPHAVIEPVSEPRARNGVFCCRDGSAKSAAPPLRDRYRDAQRFEKPPFWRD